MPPTNWPPGRVVGVGFWAWAESTKADKMHSTPSVAMLYTRVRVTERVMGVLVRGVEL